MKKILIKVGFVLVCFVAAFGGGIAGNLTIDTLQNKEYKLCKAETMNECLISGERVKDCMAEARDECD